METIKTENKVESKSPEQKKIEEIKMSLEQVNVSLMKSSIEVTLLFEHMMVNRDKDLLWDLMFDVVDDMLSPIYNLGDTVLAQFLDNKPIKSDGDYLLKIKDYDSWLFIHVYVKDNGYLVAPLNNNNSKSFLPRFYTKEEFIKNAFNVHKAVRVSKNI